MGRRKTNLYWVHTKGGQRPWRLHLSLLTLSEQMPFSQMKKLSMRRVKLTSVKSFIWWMTQLKFKAWSYSKPANFPLLHLKNKTNKQKTKKTPVLVNFKMTQFIKIWFPWKTHCSFPGRSEPCAVLLWFIFQPCLHYSPTLAHSHPLSLAQSHPDASPFLGHAMQLQRLNSIPALCNALPSLFRPLNFILCKWLNN